jgi:hypothetical protein
MSGLFDRRFAAEQHRVAVDALAGDAVQPLGDVQPPDLQRLDLTRLHAQRPPARAEAVGRELVARTADAKEDLLPGKGRVIDRRQARAVGDEADPAHGLKLHQRHAAPCLLVDDLDAERRRGCGEGRGRQGARKQQEKPRRPLGHSGIKPGEEGDGNWREVRSRGRRWMRGVRGARLPRVSARENQTSRV